jgi:hypothetical protein
MIPEGTNGICAHRERPLLIKPQAGPHSGATAVCSGYTGDACDACGGWKVRRVGPCTVCDDCGKGGGCG